MPHRSDMQALPPPICLYAPASQCASSQSYAEVARQVESWMRLQYLRTGRQGTYINTGSGSWGPALLRHRITTSQKCHHPPAAATAEPAASPAAAAEEGLRQPGQPRVPLALALGLLRLLALLPQGLLPRARLLLPPAQPASNPSAAAAAAAAALPAPKPTARPWRCPAAAAAARAPAAAGG